MKLTKKQLDEYLGRNVIITFRDGKEIQGQLCFADDFSSKHYWRLPNYYYIGNMSFKVSHVKNIKLLRG